MRRFKAGFGRSHQGRRAVYPYLRMKRARNRKHHLNRRKRYERKGELLLLGIFMVLLVALVWV